MTQRVMDQSELDDARGLYYASRCRNCNEVTIWHGMDRGGTKEEQSANYLSFLRGTTEAYANLYFCPECNVNAFFDLVACSTR